MKCPRCGVENFDEAERCQACGEEFADSRPTMARSPSSLDTELGSGDTAADPGPPSSGRRESPGQRDSPGRRTSRSRASLFDIGQTIGPRYRILRRLGAGGMGEVYLASDQELDREVALKIIRGDLAEDPSILERFKREIHLSSRVTHKNVLRVFDLGEADGVKFLTMQFIEGEDLASLMRRQGRLPIEKTVEIFRQICEGLAAAHDQGVLHRDLKPQNIMVDRTGRVAITDFGLAKSSGQFTLTEAGKIIGTPHYMSPEQVKGLPLDARSDIFSLGIMLYEMLTGAMPFTGGSAYEIMAQRIHGTPIPATQHNPRIPPYLQRILQRCLEPDLTLRYVSVNEILRDLDAQSFHTSVSYEIRRKRKTAAVVAVIALLVVVGAAIMSRRSMRQSAEDNVTAAHKPVSVLIADLANRTGDTVFDGTLEPMLSVALEGASFITSYNRVDAKKVAAQIDAQATSLDEKMARLVAGREGLNVVVGGMVSRDGSGYKLALNAVDAITGKPIGNSDVSADTKEKMLSAVGRAAADLRSALGDTTPTSIQLTAAETFTAGSLEAAHEYAVAQDLFYRGKFDEAIRHYDAAVQLDPNLGRAYSGLAASYANTGRPAEAEAAFKQAMAHIDRMSDREKYRTRGLYYLVMRNYAKAAEELSQLVKQYPSDMGGLNNLALAYFYQRDMARALEASQKPISLYPNDVVARSNAALYAMYAGQFDTAIAEAQKVQQLNPTYVSAFTAIALSQVAKNDLAGATGTYQREGQQNMGARGQAIASMGLADIALLQGRVRDAIATLEKGIDVDRTNKRDAAANQKAATLAAARLESGDPLGAVTMANQAAEAATKTRDVHTLYIAAQTLIGAGRDGDAQRIASFLDSQLEAERQHYGRLLEGESLLHAGKAREALAKFDEAAHLADSWLMRFDRGRTYLALNAFTEADSDLDACVKRRGEATAVFLDDVPTYHFYPPVLYYLGRAREGLASPSATESYRQFVAVRANAENDPLVSDARKRLASPTK